MEWISVKDRLPEENETVLLSDGEYVYCGGYGMVRNPREKELMFYGDNFGYDGDIGPSPETTHWMPLPDPPNMPPTVSTIDGRDRNRDAAL